MILQKFSLWQWLRREVRATGRALLCMATCCLPLFTYSMALSLDIEASSELAGEIEVKEGYALHLVKAGDFSYELYACNEQDMCAFISEASVAPLDEEGEAFAHYRSLEELENAIEGVVIPERMVAYQAMVPKSSLQPAGLVLNVVGIGLVVISFRSSGPLAVAGLVIGAALASIGTVFTLSSVPCEEEGGKYPNDHPVAQFCFWRNLLHL